MKSDGSSARMSRRGLLLLGGGAVLSGVAACGGRSGTTKPTALAAKTQQLHVDFESGSLGSPISQHLGATVSADFASTGNYGCRLEPLPANGDLAALVFGDTAFLPHKPWAAFSMSFRLVTQPKPSDTYMNLFEIGNTGTAFPKSQFTAYFKHDALVCDFNSHELMQITSMPILGAWHRIDVVVGYGATRYTARVRYDDGATKELVSKDNKTAESVRVLWIHYPTVPVDYTMDVDDIRMMTSSDEPKFISRQ